MTPTSLRRPGSLRQETLDAAEEHQGSTTPRVMREPEHVAVAPVIVSDATSLAVVGLTARQFKSFLREHDVAHARHGRRTLALLAHVTEALARMTGADLPQWNEAEIIARAAGGRR